MKKKESRTHRDKGKLLPRGTLFSKNVVPQKLVYNNTTKLQNACIKKMNGVSMEHKNKGIPPRGPSDTHHKNIKENFVIQNALYHSNLVGHKTTHYIPPPLSFFAFLI
ncbi:hypothetical protein ACOSP7_025182 [Xanthoceras sorbifolium]